MTKHDIMELLNADTWEQVKAEYDGKTVEEIKAGLDYMAPNERDTSQELAQDIFELVSRN